MILTGHELRAAHGRGDIDIEPFDSDQLNPNSYNFRLAPQLLLMRENRIDAEQIPIGGYVLLPGQLYLASTVEVLGSRRYAMSLLGRSSLGRLGLFLNITADLGHRGSRSNWTLELKVVQPLRVYSDMLIGQICFWETSGRAEGYAGRYFGDRKPVANKDPSVASRSYQIKQ